MKFFALLALFVLCMGSFSLGLYRGFHQMWPTVLLRAAFHKASHNEVEYDSFGRLITFPGKQEITCPQQTPHTMVLMVFGQSNSSNGQGQRYKAINDRVINYFNGKCYIAASPLLGATGVSGETWTLLGNKLIQTGKYDFIIIDAFGVGGSTIGQWAVNGDLHPLIAVAANDLLIHYQPTHILWHQGEGDLISGTAQSDYMRDFHTIADNLRELTIKAPIYISQASRVSGEWNNWQPNNPIVKAQIALVDGKTTLAGINSDILVSDMDRYDGVHFSGSGQEIAANAWVQILTK